MATVDVYGPVVQDDQVEDAWLNLALKWVDTYLVAAEREAGEQPRTYARPEHWGIEDELRIGEDDITPLLICASPGETEQPADDGGIVASTIRIGYGLYYRAGTRDDARKAVRRYGWALAALADQQVGELAELCQLRSRPRKTYDELAANSDFALAVTYVSFDVLISDIRSRYGGPAEPIDPDTDPPADPAAPTVTSVEVELDTLDDQ